MIALLSAAFAAESRPGVAILQVIGNGSVSAPWAGGDPGFGANAGVATMIRPSGDHCVVVRPSAVAGASFALEGPATPVVTAGVTAGCVLVPRAVQLTAGFAYTIRLPAGEPASLAPSFPVLLALPVNETFFPALVVTPSASGVSTSLQLVLNVARGKIPRDR